ncbi:MAG: GvpL/GvpF family gas vesicle protein [Bacteroidota bacterium]
MADLIYVFGITKKDSDDGISHDGMTAITTTVSASDFGEESIETNMKNIDWLTKRVVWHQENLNKWAMISDVIPFKFGSIFRSEKRVQEMIIDRATEFQTIFQKISGREEWGVKLFYQKDKVTSWLTKNDHGLLEKAEEMARSSPGKAFMLKKKYEQHIKDCIKELINSAREQIYHMIKQLSVEVLLLNEQVSELTHHEGVNALNASLLLDKGTADEFTKKCNLMHDDLFDKGLQLEYSGPWPPYNFTTL